MLKNLSPRFIEELENPNRKPFALLEILSRGVYAEVKTEANWGDNVDENNVDYTPTPPDSGEVILAAASGENTYSGIVPTSDISSDFGSNAYTDVDEYPTASDGDYIQIADGTGDFIGGITDDQKKAILAAIPERATIKKVRVLNRCMHYNSPAVHTARAWIRVNGSNHYHTTTNDVTSSWVDYWSEWTENPETLATWLREELYNIDGFGTRLVAGNDTGKYVRCSQIYMEIVYYDFETDGDITTGFDLSGANTDNDVLVSIDQKTPDGTSIIHTLQNAPTETFSPDSTSGNATTNGDNAIDGDSDTYSDTNSGLSSSAISFYIDWPDGVYSAADIISAVVYVTYARISGTENLALNVLYGGSYYVMEADGNGAVSKTTKSYDVTSYAQSSGLNAVRVQVHGTAASGGGTHIYIYEAWMEVKTYQDVQEVVDGSRVPADGNDGFRVVSSFSSDGTETPVLYSIRLDIPDHVYRFHTESLCEAIPRSYPYLDGIPGRSTSIDLKEFVTIGTDLKANLIRDELVTQMLRENHFKNLQASVRIGLYRDDITINDLVYTFQGKVSGYTVGVDRITVNLKDGMSDLSATWPQGSGTSTPPAKTFDGAHLVDVIQVAMDDLVIKPRFINSSSLQTVKDSVGPNFLTYRGASPPVASGDTTITEPQSAKKVFGELLEILGAYMTPQEDGRISFVAYDSDAAAVDDPWDDFVDDPTYNPDVENLKNVTYVFFDWKGSGEDAKNFANLLIYDDETSKSDWDETAVRTIKNKWLCGSASDGYFGAETAATVAARETARRKDGMGLFPCKTTLSKFPIQVGDMVDIDMSDRIINPDVGEGDIVKFFVASKDPDWENDTISWKLVEAR